MRIVSMTDQLAVQFQGLHFPNMQPLSDAWQPAVNVYAYDDHFEVCVELAGVRKQEIKVEVEQGRLTVRGQRQLPDIGFKQTTCSRILVMEIPDGAFERILDFPVAVETGKVSARQDDGWLWITLPILQGEDEK
jgi:HSP20 family protein